MHMLRKTVPAIAGLAVAAAFAASATVASAGPTHGKPKPSHGVEGAAHTVRSAHGTAHSRAADADADKGTAATDRDRDNEAHEGLNTSKAPPLPAAAMEAALQAKGQVDSSGVLSVEVDRTDMPNVMLDSPAGAVPAKPSWEVNDTLTFQPLANGKAFFNGDIALKPSELDGAIHAITSNGLVFQAEHQHMYDFSPLVFFVHFRGLGSPVQLANEVHAVLKATSVPLPQTPPANPTTPLDVNRLKSILHGFSATVGSDGVVTVLVARRNPVLIDGVRVDPSANIATNVIFEPLNASGSDTAVMPDFSMVASEINPVVSTMQGMGWDIGCLYNQETDEHPQLYFSHEFRHGDPYALAAEVRQGLDRMNMQ